MHDEAAPHYIDMIDQTTYGHKFIKEQFNVTPRIGWQIARLVIRLCRLTCWVQSLDLILFTLGKLITKIELSEKGINVLKSSGGAPRVLVHLHRFSRVLSPRTTNLHLVVFTLKLMMIPRLSRMTSTCLTTMLKNELMISWLLPYHRRTLLAQIM